MIRVLHYGMSPNRGGIETFLWDLACVNDPKRFHFDYLYSDAGARPAFADELEAQGSTLFGVTPRRASPWRNRQDLRALFAEHEFDILHFHANTASYLAPVRAALDRGVQVVYHSHNTGARSTTTRAMHRLNRFLMPWNRVSRVAVSDRAGLWMFGAETYEVVHNGIDIDKFTFRHQSRIECRQMLGIDDKTLVLGHVGAFLPAKNHDFVLKLFAELLKRRPDCELLLVGEGVLMSYSRSAASHLGVEDRVRFLGRRTDIPALLCAMDLLLLPSLYEGFPMVALEAQAAGLPCLLSDRVPSEVAIAPTCRVKSLQDSASSWVDTIDENPANLDRSVGANALRTAGLDVADTTRHIHSLYEHVAKGHAA